MREYIVIFTFNFNYHNHSICIVTDVCTIIMFDIKPFIIIFIIIIIIIVVVVVSLFIKTIFSKAGKILVQNFSLKL